MLKKNKLQDLSSVVKHDHNLGLNTTHYPSPLLQLAVIIPPIKSSLIIHKKVYAQLYNLVVITKTT